MLKGLKNDRKMAAQTEPKVKEIFTWEVYAKPVFWQLQKQALQFWQCHG